MGLVPMSPKTTPSAPITIAGRSDTACPAVDGPGGVFGDTATPLHREARKPRVRPDSAMSLVREPTIGGQVIQQLRCRLSTLDNSAIGEWSSPVAEMPVS